MTSDSVLPMRLGLAVAAPTLTLALASVAVAQPVITEHTVTIPGPINITDTFMAIDMGGATITAGDYNEWSLVVDWIDPAFAAQSAECRVFLSSSDVVDTTTDTIVRYSGEGSSFIPSFTNGGTGVDNPFPNNDMTWGNPRFLGDYQGGDPLFLHVQQEVPFTGAQLLDIRLTLIDLPDFTLTALVVPPTVQRGDTIAGNLANSQDLLGANGVDRGPTGNVGDFFRGVGNEDVYVIDWDGGPFIVNLCTDTFLNDHVVRLYSSEEELITSSTVDVTEDVFVGRDVTAGSYFIVVESTREGGGEYELRIDDVGACPPRVVPTDGLFAVAANRLFRIDESTGEVGLVDSLVPAPGQPAFNGSLLGMAFNNEGRLLLQTTFGMWEADPSTAELTFIGDLNESTRCIADWANPLDRMPNEDDVQAVISQVNGAGFSSLVREFAEPTDTRDAFDLAAYMVELTLGCPEVTTLSYLFGGGLAPDSQGSGLIGATAATSSLIPRAEETITISGPFLVSPGGIAIDLGGADLQPGVYIDAFVVFDWEDFSGSGALSFDTEIWLSDSENPDIDTDGIVRYTGEGIEFSPLNGSTFATSVSDLNFGIIDFELNGGTNYGGGDPIFLHVRQPGTNAVAEISNIDVVLTRREALGVLVSLIDTTTGRGAPGAPLTYSELVGFQVPQISGMDLRSDGNLVAIERATNSLVELDPQTGVITKIDDLISQPGFYGGLAIVSDTEAYYVTAADNSFGNGDGALYRFDPFTGEQALVVEFETAVVAPGTTVGFRGLATPPAPQQP
ncbi:MAG: hypothetical protein AAGI30_01670 [Planctomycetota bacterium]